MSLSQKISNHEVDDTPRVDLWRSLRGLGPESPAETGDFASRPESPVGPRSPSLGDHIEQIESKNHKKVARKMIDSH
jgi:hypothetical protein